MPCWITDFVVLQASSVSLETMRAGDIERVCVTRGWCVLVALRDHHFSLSAFKTHPLFDCLKTRLLRTSCRFFTVCPQCTDRLHLHLRRFLFTTSCTKRRAVRQPSIFPRVAGIWYIIFYPPEVLLCCSFSLSIWKIPLSFKDSENVLDSHLCAFLTLRMHTFWIPRATGTDPLVPSTGLCLGKVCSLPETNLVPGITGT